MSDGDGTGRGSARPLPGSADTAELRDATPADAHAVATVIVRSWRVAYRGQLPDDVLADLSVPDRERLWSEILTGPPRTRTVVATIGPVVVGVAATGPPLVPADRGDPTVGDLYALYLDPDLWSRGLGTRLHAAALDRLRSGGCTHAGLWVLATNERALRFYHRHGWIDTGRTQVDRGPGGVELHERRLRRSLTATGRDDGSRSPAG
ncbi:GNAT family N-acetyltransferase [Pseudonocardia petroleophila]|uniref:GNAT family N-acetyltransferase n=1 Tax=Pseudonocardia petroleophila TaxID=37331 RepID=A0A7G7MBJ1_9PSEU|nr:GNAT family N-acetyltransferase [Pseudonocardia petroleophila]QNG50152.1 GNAT family N-acetyltransferase [Pseudonocardia petroleophila]